MVKAIEYNEFHSIPTSKQYANAFKIYMVSKIQNTNFGFHLTCRYCIFLSAVSISVVWVINTSKINVACQHSGKYQLSSMEKKKKKKGINLHHQHQEPWEVQILYGNFDRWTGVSNDQ